MEFGVRFNFDDGGISDKIAQQGRDLEKFNKLWKEYEKTANQAARSTVAELIKTEKEMANMAVTMAQNASESEKTYSKIKADIGSVALAIAGSIPNADKFVATINKLKNAELNGVALDLDTVEQELINIVAEAKLTDDQMRILVNNVDEVAKAVVAVSDGNFDEMAEKTEKVTKEFSSAKAELRALTSLINSGELQGEALVQAKERAGELTDTIGDTRDEIKRMASDTKGFDKIADAAKLMASGMQIAEGSAALLGDESEDMQKTLIRLNAIMAVSTGLHQLATEVTTKGTLANKAAAIAQGAYGTVVGTSTGALKVFRITLAATGIGLIVILLGALVANWDKVSGTVGKATGSFLKWTKGITEGIPFIGKIASGIEYLYNNFEKVGSIISGVTASIGSFFSNAGNVVGSLLKLDFDGAKAAFGKLGSDSAAAYNNAFAGAEKVRVETDNLTSIVASQKKKLEIMQEAGKDTNALQKNILANEKKLLLLQNADKEKIAEKEQEIAVNNARVAKEQADKAKEARDKAAEAYKDYLNELNKINDDVKKANRANQLDSIDDSTIEGKIQKLKLQQQFELEDLEASKKITLEKIKNAEQKAKLIDEFGQLELAYQIKNARELLKLEKEARELYKKTIEDNAKETVEIIKQSKDAEAKARLETNLTGIGLSEQLRIQALDREIKFGKLSVDQLRAKEVEKLQVIVDSIAAQRRAYGLVVNKDTLKLDEDLKAAQAELTAFKEGVKNEFKDFSLENILKKAFGGDDKETEALVKGFSALKDAIFNVVNEGYEAEISAIDDVINARKDKISELEGLIKEELEAKNAGYANSYDALVAQKANEEALIKEDNAKKVQIQKEQLRITTAIQAAEQVGALATAVAGIFSKSAGALGPFGIPIAVAAIISMFALYKNYKAQVASLTKAYKGGKVSDYLDPGVTARTDKGSGRGHRVEDTNMVIGANEFIVNEDSTSANLPFLKEMNSGKYDNVNLRALLNTKSDAQHVSDFNAKRQKQANSITIQIDRAIEKQTAELRKDFERQTKAIIEDNAQRPTVIPLPSGAVKVIYHEKGNSRIEIIRPS